MEEERRATPAHVAGTALNANDEHKDNTFQNISKADIEKKRLFALIDNATEPDEEEIRETCKPAGMLTIKSSNQWMREAATRPDPEPLWLSLWYEGEIACLFADSNAGKSIYAVEIAAKIAEGRKVIYFDFELSDKVFQRRYTNEFGGLHRFPDNFLRAEIDPYSLNLNNFEDTLINEIEGSAIANDSKILIIDNLTYLCNASEKGDLAGLLMLRLMQLKKKHGLSILILAHTPKRSLFSAITQNDLAGSKKLFNFFDSVFAIGKSAKDDGLRYIKQLKSRNAAITYGADNVIVAEICKDNDFLRFRLMGEATEREHLKEFDDKDISKMEENVKEMREGGKSVREIAQTLGVSKSKIGRIVQKLNNVPLCAEGE